MGIAATALDLVVEFAFLSWAVRRHGWIIKGFEWSKIGMGPQMYFGANRKKEWEKANAKRVQRVVDAVMEMGVPAGTTKEQVEIITIAHNADINAVVEVVMKVDFVSVQGPDKSKV
ncbi:hypothetical protein BC830DRAFT_166438 [Chytriomyces sp. MP71]|nr:hypothetical protein BC830DRAFT_166438 [Chytriomyces sp. MP71]